MEYCEGGTLEDIVIKKKGSLNEEEAIYYFK